MRRSDWARFIVNLVGFDVAWTGSVLLAAAERPYLGAAVALANGALQIGVSRRPGRLALLVVGGAVVGTAVDAALLAAGAFSFSGSGVVSAPFLVWFAALWINFGSMLDGALRPLHRRLALAGALGLVGGPMAYWLAARLGAIGLAERPWITYASFGVEWAIVTPLWLLVTRRALVHGEARR